MTATALLPVFSTHAPGLATAGATAAPANGPGSFARLLDAADARRQLERNGAAQREQAQAERANTERSRADAARADRARNAPGRADDARAEGRADGAATAPPTRPAPAQDRTATRPADRGAASASSKPRATDAAAQAEGTEDEAAQAAGRSTGAEATNADADPEAASLLASLGLTLPPGAARPDGAGATAALAGDAAEAGRGRGGRGGVRGALAGPSAALPTSTPAAAAASTAALADKEGSASASGSAFAALMPGTARPGEAGSDKSVDLRAAGLGSAARAGADTPADAARSEALASPGTLPQSGSTAAPGSSAATPAEARLPASPGSREFGSQLGAQLSTFVREGVQHARLQLHPLELGPVTVQIQIDGGNAQVNFAAEHAQTRHAIEQALPALAGSLREAGLTLSGGGVFEQPSQPQARGEGQAGGSGGRGGSESGTAAGRDEGQALRSAASAPALRRRGVVDLVA